MRDGCLPRVQAQLPRFPVVPVQTLPTAPRRLKPINYAAVPDGALATWRYGGVQPAPSPLLRPPQSTDAIAVKPLAADAAAPPPEAAPAAAAAGEIAPPPPAAAAPAHAPCSAHVPAPSVAAAAAAPAPAGGSVEPDCALAVAEAHSPHACVSTPAPAALLRPCSTPLCCAEPSTPLRAAPARSAVSDATPFVQCMKPSAHSVGTQRGPSASPVSTSCHLPAFSGSFAHGAAAVSPTGTRLPPTPAQSLTPVGGSVLSDDHGAAEAGWQRPLWQQPGVNTHLGCANLLPPPVAPVTKPSTQHGMPAATAVGAEHAVGHACELTPAEAAATVVGHDVRMERGSHTEALAAAHAVHAGRAVAECGSPCIVPGAATARDPNCGGSGGDVRGVLGGMGDAGTCAVAEVNRGGDVCEADLEELRCVRRALLCLSRRGAQHVPTFMWDRLVESRVFRAIGHGRNRPREPHPVAAAAAPAADTEARVHAGAAHEPAAGAAHAAAEVEQAAPSPCAMPEGVNGRTPQGAHPDGREGPATRTPCKREIVALLADGVDVLPTSAAGSAKRRRVALHAKCDAPGACRWAPYRCAPLPLPHCLGTLSLLTRTRRVDTATRIRLNVHVSAC